jgi:hypothetical protein
MRRRGDACRQGQGREGREDQLFHRNRLLCRMTRGIARRVRIVVRKGQGLLTPWRTTAQMGAVCAPHNEHYGQFIQAMTGRRDSHAGNAFAYTGA